MLNGTIDNTVLAAKWGDVLRSSNDEIVLRCARIIAPDIKDLHILAPVFTQGDTSSHALIPIVSMKGLQSRIPLRALGDGVVRAVNLSVEAVSAAGGMLLIDEIDTGLHYSIMADIWRLLFRVAKDLNVQVFATTHSWDCIEAFNEAAQETEGDDEAMLIRLGRFKGDVVSTLYSKSELNTVTRGHIEVR